MGRNTHHPPAICHPAFRPPPFAIHHHNTLTDTLKRVPRGLASHPVTPLSSSSSSAVGCGQRDEQGLLLVLASAGETGGSPGFSLLRRTSFANWEGVEWPMYRHDWPHYHMSRGCCFSFQRWTCPNVLNAVKRCCRRLSLSMAARQRISQQASSLWTYVCLLPRSRQAHKIGGCICSLVGLLPPFGPPPRLLHIIT